MQPFPAFIPDHSEDPTQDLHLLTFSLNFLPGTAPYCLVSSFSLIYPHPTSSPFARAEGCREDPWHLLSSGAPQQGKQQPQQQQLTRTETVAGVGPVRPPRAHASPQSVLDLPWFPPLCIESAEKRLHVGVPQNTMGYDVLIEHGSVAHAQLILVVLSWWFWFRFYWRNGIGLRSS